MKKFNCSKCGLCCTKLNLNKVYDFLNRGDGICKYYNEELKTCSIYDNRPVLCNIEKSYELYFNKQFTKEEFYKLNSAICKKWQNINNNN